MSTTFKKDQTSQARDQAGQAVDKVRDAASHAGEALSSAAAAVGQKADEAAGSVGTGIKSVADTIRQQGPQEGMLGNATRTVAGAIDQTGRYLEEKHLSGMADDVASVIKAHPIPAVLIGLGVGFLLGRALRD